MKISSIKITNFRGFTEKSFYFDQKMTVVLGNNTAGKTTLLHAVQIALGSYLQALTLISGGPFFSRNYKKSDHVSKYSDSTKSFLPDVNNPRIEVEAQFSIGKFNTETHGFSTDTQTIKWAREGSKNSKKNNGELIDIVQQIEDIRRIADNTKENAVFPLMLSFGATRLEKNYNGAEKTRVRASREEKAYKCALDEQVDFKSAFDWIYSYEKNIMKDLDFQGTDQAFIKALLVAIPALKQIHIDRKNAEFTAQIQMAGDESPRWLTYDMMSDGFKAMINIVAEIAYRCIMLNGFLGEDAVVKTPGLVMIDELDLYLHPHWQQHILSDLQKAFPEFQFIVTTHSPFIVQSVESKNIITLDGQKGGYDPNKRGIEEIIVSEMGMDGLLRSEKYRKQLELADKYYQLVKQGKAKREDIDKVKHELENLELELTMMHDPAFEAFLRLNRGDL